MHAQQGNKDNQGRCWHGMSPVLDLSCHGHEGLLDIGRILGTGLQEGDANLICKCLHTKNSNPSDPSLTRKKAMGCALPAFSLKDGKRKRVWTSAHLGCLIVHNLLCCQVTLVPDQQLVDILIGISINLIEPLLDIVKAVLICHIIHHLHACHMNVQGPRYSGQPLTPVCKPRQQYSPL